MIEGNVYVVVRRTRNWRAMVGVEALCDDGRGERVLVARRSWLKRGKPFLELAQVGVNMRRRAWGNTVQREWKSLAGGC